jgi:hypothetical protein
MAADELDIQTLIQCIQKHLIKHQREFLQQQLSTETLEMCYQHKSFTDLLNFYLEIISKKPEVIFNSNKFINLKEPLLELLLKENFLLLDEIVIWNKLIKWSFAKHPSIQQDVKKWNKEEIAMMERTFHKFIPLIKFYNIPPDDFVSKVYPYKVLIPEDLVNEILNIDKRTSQNYDTIIVKPRHFAIFSSWIEKKNDTYYNIRDIPYQFNLIYRASRDGNTVEEFHEKCDNKGPTIVIAKVENSEQIVGGYNPLQWDLSNNYKSTKNSFIFSFTNKAKVGYINDDHFAYSVYCNQKCGPTFGRGHDLFHSERTTWRSYVTSYPEIDIPNPNVNDWLYNEFNVEDYEVFQVIKK